MENNCDNDYWSIRAPIVIVIKASVIIIKKNDCDRKMNYLTALTVIPNFGFAAELPCFKCDMTE